MPTEPRIPGIPLRPGRLGTGRLALFAIAAAAPLTAVGGAVPIMYAVSGNAGAAFCFLVLTIVLAVFAVGYTSMSRYVPNPGAFSSYIAKGLGRAGAVAAAFVALLAYNAIQIGLYGLIGAILGEFVGEEFALELDWWIWALVAWAVVSVLGVLQRDLSGRVLVILLILELLVLAALVVLALDNPAGGRVSVTGLDPGSLSATGLGAVLALGAAAFVGVESAPAYRSQARNPRHTVARASHLAIVATGACYALSAWALTVATGPANTATVAAVAGPGLVADVLARHGGATLAVVAQALLATAVLAALLGGHNAVTRQLYGLGFERVLPGRLGRVGVRRGAPVAASLVQTGLALAVLVGFAAAGRDPVTELFTWLTAMGAVGVLLLLTLTSVAVLNFFNHRPEVVEARWRRLVAPTLATMGLSVVLVVLLADFGTLLAPGAPGYLRGLLPGLPGLVALAGLLWGLALRSSQPEVYARVGGGALEPVPAPHPVAVRRAGTPA
ncbi:amino acid/polyamine/organocation transporter (APC superfamily) [Micromonospora pisi]|uniref:Amino acid/polyamine/organocation transporter (APC superfamily) n=1 Tax=Micromonospora pisi TaxID=589240 RepID=A0A495JSK1_9ACTN|nr:APC family permease [Micromonospora pisi]RKR91342.1 amino acid/polyamine/organocation transporter (APC superfamily) [Micromonospora pisi]